MTDYNTLAYPHTEHRRFVRGCDMCLQRTKAAQRRYTESKRRIREQNAARAAAYASSVQRDAAARGVSPSAQEYDDAHDHTHDSEGNEG